MKTIAISLLIAAFTCLTASAQNVNKKISVLFETDKYELSQEAKKTIDAFLENIPPDDDSFELQISGHTDSDGMEGYNLVLSKRRAQAVQEYLKEKNVEKQLVVIEHKGEYQPVKPNNNAKNKQANRRVEISLAYRYYKNIEEVESALHKNHTHTFEVNPNTQHLFTTPAGTRIAVRPGSFVDAKGKPVKEKVLLSITEAYDYTAMAALGLSTVSNGKLLESGGMFKLDAVAENGKPVSINPQSGILIAAPNNDVKDDMQLFTSNSGSNWETTTTPLYNRIARFDLPEPKASANPIKLPTYKSDLKSKPRPPGKPVKPSEPRMPNKDDYFRAVKWYQIPFKRSIVRKQEARYQRAMMAYAQKMDRYDVKMQRYLEAMENYDMNLAKYEYETLLWLARDEDQREALKNTPEYLELKALYDAYQKEVNEKYATEHSAWKIAYRSYLNEQMAVREAENKLNAKLVNDYIFETTSLDWINIDRFKVSDKPRTIFAFKSTENNKNEKVLLLFEDSKSLLTLTYNAKQKRYECEGFPTELKAKLLMYKVEQGKLYACLQDVDSKDAYSAKYQTISVDGLRSIMQQFGRV